jgi:hypothetical protein
MKRLIINGCILMAVLCGSGMPTATPTAVGQHHHAFSSWHQFSFKIDDSQCRVGIAAVKLSVSELKPKDGNLVATYSIRVPLKKSENDTGLIVLPIDVTVDELSQNGGVLRGKAYSNEKDKTPNAIICEIGPLTDQGIQLEITTDTRILNFTSRYTVLNTSDES